MKSLEEYKVLEICATPVLESIGDVMFESTAIKRDDERGQYLLSHNGKTFKVPFRTQNGHGDDMFSYDGLMEKTHGDNNEAVKLIKKRYKDILANSDLAGQIPEILLRKLSAEEFGRIRSIESYASGKDDQQKGNAANPAQPNKADGRKPSPTTVSSTADGYQVSDGSTSVIIPRMDDKTLKGAVNDRNNSSKDGGAGFTKYRVDALHTIRKNFPNLAQVDAGQIADTLTNLELKRAGKSGFDKQSTGKYKAKGDAQKGLYVISPDGKSYLVGWQIRGARDAKTIAERYSAAIKKKVPGIPDPECDRIANGYADRMAKYLATVSKSTKPTAQKTSQAAHTDAPAAQQTKGQQGKAAAQQTKGQQGKAAAQQSKGQQGKDAAQQSNPVSAQAAVNNAELLVNKILPNRKKTAE